MKRRSFGWKHIFEIAVLVAIIDFSITAAWYLFKGIVVMCCDQYLGHHYAAYVLIGWSFLRASGGAILSAWAIFILGKSGRNRFKVLTLAVVVLAAVLLAEFMYVPPSDPSYIKINDGLYSFKPNTDCNVTLNIKTKRCKIGSDGFRTCAFSNASEGPLIVLIGDSFVFGWRLSDGETLCDSLGNELMRRNFGEATIKNLGIPGINFDSYAKMARMIASRARPDWIFVGYLSYKVGNGGLRGGVDTLPEDFFSFKAGMEKMSLYKLTSALLGAPTAFRAPEIYNRIAAETPPGEKTALRLSDAISVFKELSDRSNIVILSYYGPDEFTDILKKRIGKLSVIDLSLSESFPGEYFFPYDGHPTAKANLEYARRIADFIMLKQEKR